MRHARIAAGAALALTLALAPAVARGAGSPADPGPADPDAAGDRPSRLVQVGLGVLAGALAGGGGAVATWHATRAECSGTLRCDLESRAWTVGAATLGWTLGAAWGVWLGGLTGDWRGSLPLTVLSALGGALVGGALAVGLTLIDSSLAGPAVVVGALGLPLGAALLGHAASERPPGPTVRF